MLCKVNMEKAYDHVNWGFLDQIMDKRKNISLFGSPSLKEYPENFRPGKANSFLRGKLTLIKSVFDIGYQSKQGEISCKEFKGGRKKKK